jgi:osmoprotectant transport system permease protein
MTLADQFQPGTFVDAFRFIGGHGGLLLSKTAEHLELSLAALGIALVLALPLGLWLGHRHRGLFLALGVSSVGRALPSLVLIAFGLTILGIGFWNNTAALVVLAIPPILTNAYFAVDGVDPVAVEAARGMGLTEAQVLRRIELPLGLSLAIAGIRIAAIFVIATATIAAVAGGGGLGDIIVDQADYGLAGIVAASYCVSALAIAFALVLEAIRRAVSHSRPPTTAGDVPRRRRRKWFASTRAAQPRRATRSRSQSRF